MKKKLNYLCVIVFGWLMVSGEWLVREDGSEEYVLVFHDEFSGRNGSQPDSTKWRRSQRNPSAWARWISNSPDVVRVKNGKLICRAIPNRTEVGDTAQMLTGAIESTGKFSFQYGKVEVRMRTNLKQGNFPAAWMKPEQGRDNRYGEIDIVEMFGNVNKSHHTIHTHQTYTLKKKKPTNFERTLKVNRWHVYGIVWTPDYIEWTVDGQSVGVYRRSSAESDVSEGQWTFDRPFYLRLNQSVGNGVAKHFIAQTSEVYETEFDWVRVYQKKVKK